VSGRGFDLIVCNPPFVLSPESGFLFRDGGRPGDGLLEALVRQAPQHLNEGGCCQLICQWAHLRGQDWRERLAGWARGSGCDLWALQSNTDPAAAHAEKWAGGEEEEAVEELAARMGRWVAYCEGLGIEQISGGLIFLRKRAAGPNWAFFNSAPNVGGDVGRAIELGFALRDWLATHSDEEVWQARFQINPGTRLQRELAVAETGWATTGTTLRIQHGLQYEGNASEVVMNLLGRCRGQTALRQVLTDLETETGQSLDRTQALHVVRAMVEQGLLLPAPPRGD
jgi:hypothetical protein